MTEIVPPSEHSRPVVLCILDGWGERAETADNAIALGNTPNWDRFMAEALHARLDASAEEVGLPAGQMGNSEVGHMNLGTGRVVDQDFTRINKAIDDGELAVLMAFDGKEELFASLGSGSLTTLEVVKTLTSQEACESAANPETLPTDTLCKWEAEECSGKFDGTTKVIVTEQNPAHLVGAASMEIDTLTDVTIVESIRFTVAKCFRLYRPSDTFLSTFKDLFFTIFNNFFAKLILLIFCLDPTL